MAQFKILECDETGSMKYYALRIEIEGDGERGIVDCVVCEYFDVNSDSSYCEIISVESKRLENVVRELGDEIIAAM